MTSVAGKRVHSFDCDMKSQPCHHSSTCINVHVQRLGATRKGRHSSYQLLAVWKSPCLLGKPVFCKAPLVVFSSHRIVTRKSENSKTAGLKMKYAVASGYVFPLLGSTAMIIVSTKRNYNSGKKKKKKIKPSVCANLS